MTHQRALLLGATFVSSGLVLYYELVWFRLVSLEIGSQFLSSALIVGFFLGGNAFGCAIGKFVFQRIEKIGIWYGAIEILIGIVTVGFSYLLSQIVNSGVSFSVQITSAAALILVPSTLIGMTFPAQIYLAESLDMQKPVLKIYCLSLFGAAAGCLLAGLLIIPSVNLWSALHIAFLLSAGLGVCLIVLFRRPAGHRAEALDTSQQIFVSVPICVLVLLAFAACATSFQVVGSRLIFVAVGSSTIAFSVFLSVFLLATAIGSWLANLKPSLFSGRQNLWALPLLFCVGVFSLITVYPRIPFQFEQLVVGGTSFSEFYVFVGLSTLILVLLPCLAMGMYLPLFLEKVKAGRLERHSSIFLNYVVYGLGNAIGAVVAGIFLFKALGIFGTLVLLSGVLCVVAVVMVHVCQQRIGLRVFVGSLALCIFVAIATRQWDPNMMHYAAYVAADASGNVPFEDYYEHNFEGVEPLYRAEGAIANVASYSRQNERYLRINGKTDASTSQDLVTQTFLGVIPPLYHPDTQLNSLVIGLGSGITASMLDAESANVTVIELIPEVVEAARIGFADYNRNVFEDAKYEIHIVDAISFFASDDSTYDLIIQEPTNFWISGVASLVSTEVFNAASRHLDANGIMAVWIHGYWLSDEMFVRVLKSAIDVFPQAELFEMTQGDYLLVAGKQTLNINRKKLEGFSNQRGKRSPELA